MHPTKATKVAALSLSLALAVSACGGGRSDNNSSGGNAGGGGGGSTPGSGATGGGQAAITIDTEKCDDYQPSPGVTESEIKLGTSGPQAGAYGAAFGPIQRGYKAYFEYVNETKKGVKGKKITLTAYDDEYQSAKTITNVQKLVKEDKVFALVNVIGTPNNMAIRDDLGEQCVPNLFVGTGAVEWGQTDKYPWLIGSLPSYATEGAVFANYLKEKKPDAKVAILQQNDDFGEGYVKAFNKAIEGSNIKVTKTEKYNPGDADMSAQVTSMAGDKPDAVLLAATVLACPNAVQKIKAQQGWTPIVYVSVTCAVKALIDIGKPENFEGTVSASYLKDPADPAFENDAAIKLFKEQGQKYGMSAEDVQNGGALYGWLVGELTVKTLEQAPELTRKSVMETAYSLKGLKSDTLRDGVTINTNGAADPFPIESLYIGTFKGTGYKPEGKIIDFEGKTVQFLK